MSKYVVPPQFAENSTPDVERSPPNWAILVGLVRNETLAREALLQLAEWRRDGVLDGVVVASWNDEYDAYPALLAIIQQEGFTLCECPQPLLKLTGHVLHQSRAVRLALEFVPRGAFVFKWRPDLWHANKELKPRIGARKLAACQPSGGRPPVFVRKPIVFFAFLTSPFYVSDILIYAVREDLLSIFNMNYELQFVSVRMGPEQLFFGEPFRHKFNLFDLFFRMNDGLEHSNSELVIKKVQSLIQSDFYIEILSTYHICLSEYFEIGFSSESRAELPLFDARLENILLRSVPAADVTGTAATNVGIAISNHAVSALLEGRFQSSEFGDRYLAAVARVRPGGGAPLDLQHRVDGMIEAQRCVPHLIPNLPKQVGPNRFRYMQTFEGPSVMSGDTESTQLRAEISLLRRGIDALNAELTLLRAQQLDQPATLQPGGVALQ